MLRRYEMKMAWLGVLAVWLIGTMPLFGQTLSLPATSQATPECDGEERVSQATQGCECACETGPGALNPLVVAWETPPGAEPYRIWGRGEYLLWWVKNAPLPVPLVTTGDPHVGFPLANTAGAIGQPGTRVLLGESGLDFHSFSGMRFTLGGWGPAQIFGIEASGFLLERRNDTFAASSDKTGNPPLYIPAFNVVAGAERALAISDPLRGFSGDVLETSTLQLSGMEVNGLFNLIRGSALEVTFLTGFRYANLRENLHFQNTTTDLVFNNTTTLNDTFDTRNQFYGGQIGARLGWQLNQLYVDVNAKVALGSTHQMVNIQGDISQLGPNPLVPPGLGKFPGGFFAQQSNMGQFSSNPFTVMPALELKVGYQIQQWLNLFIGYDFIYWNQVVRPGNQIDHNVNPSQSPIFGGGALVGQPAPIPLFNRSDFWAQGLTFGLELRY